ncbi:P-loop NTPase fold protein [Nitrosophilus alvini]|uniref:P-loop NTPase fold protein n=1 Tax=Nitrosophilus alvini TaxID=2714855 RepID=UPI0019097470|nr:P-loop NTPase fold protein [Nitrosophilus alvini]
MGIENTEKNYVKLLKTYLIENENSYLLSDIGKNKIAMISGEWGSGKTFFWDNIRKELNEKKVKNIYISLYGKDSIQAIENELLLKAYNLSLGKKDDDENRDIIEKGFSVFTQVSTGFSPLIGFNFEKVIETVKELNIEKKFQKAGEVLNDGVIICFDDFERKSTAVNLNDLFGFITNLTIEYNCKVIIIVNSEAFKDEEAKVFKRVKEKSISKYFHYRPDKKHLFDQIVSSLNKENQELNKRIFSIIDMTDVCNARIYIQIVKNVYEYNNKYEINDNSLKILVLNTIFFSIYHETIKISNIKSPITNLSENFSELLITVFYTFVNNYKTNKLKKEAFLSRLKDRVYYEIGNKNQEQYKVLLETIEKNSDYLYDLYNYVFVYNILNQTKINEKYSRIIDKTEQEVENINQINNFIETGILL